MEASLADCHGRVSGSSGAAAKLGIPRQTLESKVKRLEINEFSLKRGYVLIGTALASDEPALPITLSFPNHFGNVSPSVASSLQFRQRTAERCVILLSVQHESDEGHSPP